jgi:hypothetical protein
VPRQHVEHAPADERRLAGQHLHRDAAERVQIRAAIGRVALGLLRRHVARIAEGHAEAGRRRAAALLDQLGQPEVEQLDEVRLAAAHRQVDVARAQIAVHEAHRVGVDQRLRHLDHHVEGALDRQPGVADEHVVEGLALEQLHRQVQAPVAGAPEVVDLDDVLVVDLRHRRRLAAEPLDRQVVARQLVVQHLDRDLAAQGHVLAAIDRPRLAGAQALLHQEPLAEHRAQQLVDRPVLDPRRAAVRAEQRGQRQLATAARAQERSRVHVGQGHRGSGGRPSMRSEYSA